jgi:hypothetical protein
VTGGSLRAAGGLAARYPQTMETIASMIVGVPDHHILKETAIGWMNLAWDSAIDEARQFQDAEFLYEDIEKEHGADVAKAAIEKHWRAKQLLLNNAFSLLQQCLEIALKAKIAEVSPFLLIAGDPRTWPKAKDGTNIIDFSNFRTIDAVQLCGAVNTVSATPLSKEFTEFYDRLRQSRNKIAHLNASAIIIEVKSLLVDILTAQKHLFPDVRWTTFRNDYLRSTEQFDDKDNLFSGDDYTPDVMAREVHTALQALDSDHLQEFFIFDDSEEAYRCPHCLAGRNESDDEREFVQFAGSDRMQCILCLSSYTVAEYKQAIIDYFGYLDPKDQDRVKKRLDDIP